MDSDRPQVAAGGSDEPLAEPVGHSEASIGAYLTSQRVLRGISLEELAGLTRIPLRNLERLESGTFDRDADGFVRGFVRTVAAALGLDPDDTVARMLSEPNEPVDGRVTGVTAHRAVLLAALVLALVVMIGVAAAGLRLLLTPATPDLERVVRRDPVRALAEAQGLGAYRPGDDPAAALPAVASARPAEPAEPARGIEAASEPPSEKSAASRGLATDSSVSPAAPAP